MVTVLPARAGTKEARYAHLLGDTPVDSSAGRTLSEAQSGHPGSPRVWMNESVRWKRNLRVKKTD
jgi:hypothetical protein